MNLSGLADCLPKRSWITAGALVFVTSGVMSASLIFDSGIEVTGTGLGAVNTIVTVHDTGDGNNIEGGCVERSGGTDVFTPCNGGVTEHDNTAINQTLTYEGILGLTSSQTVAVVVNLAETGQDLSVDLTNLYLSFYDPAGTLVHVATAVGLPDTLTSGEGTGTGASGFVYVLDAAQTNALYAAGFGTGWRIGGGVQFAQGSTNDGNETLHIIAVDRQPGDVPIPEPVTYLQLGGGLLAVALMRFRRRSR